MKQGEWINKASATPALRLAKHHVLERATIPIRFVDSILEYRIEWFEEN